MMPLYTRPTNRRQNSCKNRVERCKMLFKFTKRLSHRGCISSCERRGRLLVPSIIPRKHSSWYILSNMLGYILATTTMSLSYSSNGTWAIPLDAIAYLSRTSCGLSAKSMVRCSKSACFSSKAIHGRGSHTQASSKE